MFESKSRIAHLTETEKDLQDALTRTADRLSKAEKEVVLLSEGGESGARERDRLEDLSIKLQKQVSSLFLSVSLDFSFSWLFTFLAPSTIPSFLESQAEAAAKKAVLDRENLRRLDLHSSLKRMMQIEKCIHTWHDMTQSPSY